MSTRRKYTRKLTVKLSLFQTPSIGYHPLLKPNQTSQVDQDALLDLPMASGDADKAIQLDATIHDFTGKAKPLDFFSSAIDMPAFQAVATNSGQQRSLDGQGEKARFVICRQWSHY